MAGESLLASSRVGFRSSQGLWFLHQHGIIHRDLKSLNILLDQGWTAKICDFGLAKVTSSVASSTGRVFQSKVGSVAWSARQARNTGMLSTLGASGAFGTRRRLKL